MQVKRLIPSSRTTKWLAGILLAGVLLRVAAALYMGDTVYDLPGVFDQISYDRLAQNVVAGHGFSFDVDWWPATRAGEPTAHWSFAMTLYLAAIYKAFGYHPLVARLIQAVLAGVLMPLLTYRLAAKVSGRGVALLAAAISAVYVYFFYYAAALMTETFYFLAILAALNLAIDLARGPATGGRWIGQGLAAGCAVLFRQTFLLFVPFLLLWIWWAGGGGHKARRYEGGNEGGEKGGGKPRPYEGGGAGATEGGGKPRPYGVRFAIPVAVIALMILPWTVRNTLAFHQFVLLNTNAGYVFFWSNHPIHGTSFISLLGPEQPSYHALIPPELLSLDEASLEKALMARGLGFVAADPGRYVLLSLSRIKDHFVFWPKADSSTLSNISRVGSFGVFLPFMIYGLILSAGYAWRRRRTLPADERGAALALLYLFIVIYTGIHVLTWTGIRYRLPVDTVLVIFAAVGLADLYARVSYWGQSLRGASLATKQSPPRQEIASLRPANTMPDSARNDAPDSARNDVPDSARNDVPDSARNTCTHRQVRCDARPQRDEGAKRFLDLAVVVPGLIVLSPLLLVVAIVVRLDSRGPVLYRRRVMGRGGVPFDAFKFRTMHVDGDAILAQHPDLLAAWQRDQKLPDDPRVTRSGRTLRKLSLDELPQLFNVLAGQMSLVGPRMVVAAELPRYGDGVAELLSVRPGITGLWQVSGRSDVTGEARARLELEYVRTRSLGLDVKLLLMTVPALLRGRGAY